MQLKTDTLQDTGYKSSLNYSQSIQKEGQISKQNNTKVVLKMCVFWMRAYLNTVFINYRKFYRECAFWSKILKMISKGQRQSRKRNNKSKGSLASDMCRMVGSVLCLEHRKKYKDFHELFEMTVFMVASAKIT